MRINENVIYSDLACWEWTLNGDDIIKWGYHDNITSELLKQASTFIKSPRSAGTFSMSCVRGIRFYNLILDSMTCQAGVQEKEKSISHFLVTPKAFFKKFYYRIVSADVGVISLPQHVGGCCQLKGWGENWRRKPKCKNTRYHWGIAYQEWSDAL